MKDPRTDDFKHYEHWDRSKVYRKIHTAKIEFLVDDNGPTVFAVRKPNYWRSAAFQKYILAPVSGFMGLLSGFCYVRYPYEGREILSSISFWSSIGFGGVAAFALFDSGSGDHCAQITNTRKSLFLNRTLKRWAGLDAGITDVMSPLERRDMIFDQDLKEIVFDESYLTDVDISLQDKCINQHFHRGMNIMIEDFEVISKEPESHLRDLKLDRLDKQWDTFRSALKTHPHRPPEFVIHSSLDDLDEREERNLRKMLAQIAESRHEIIAIKKDRGDW